MNGRDGRIRRFGCIVALIAAAISIQGCASTSQVEPSVLPRGWPVPYDIAIVTSDFGDPRGPSRHEGLDLSVPKGTPVRVTADGIVSFAGRSGRYGRTVMVDHDRDYETLYAH
ncbi:MAG: M23 family metallopeptidase, partial [Acidobacteriota bacterium]